MSEASIALRARRAAFLLALSAATGWAAGGARAAEPYAPGLGDFMTAYVQPHHVKLWLAGSGLNWPLAEYEAKELRETFEDVGTYQAVWHDFPIGKMVESVLYPTLDQVDRAIKDRSDSGFRKSFEAMTQACNACHQATGNGFIVIKVPAAGAAFPDQQFPAK